MFLDDISWLKFPGFQDVVVLNTFFLVLPLLLGSDTLPRTQRTAKAPENRPGPKR